MFPNRLNILLVEDNPGDVRLIREMLAPDQDFGAIYNLSDVNSLEDAASKYAREAFDVILLDVNLPDSTGLSTIEHLSALVPQIPIVILTGMRDEQLALQSAQLGAQDYIIKNECTSPHLKRTIHYAIERKAVQERFKYLAMHDALTGLPNRTLFHDRLTQAIRHAERNRVGATLKWKAAVMLMDLDDFKLINDRLGHEKGDIILQLAARRLRASLRHSDTVARLGGDEFILIIEGIASQTDCVAVAQKLLRSLDEPVVLEGATTSVKASVGISIFPDDAQEIEALIRYADVAMYKAKRQHSRISFFQETVQ
ncbi:MAG TPA: GGDEF domain-containing response regulator [Anaerolineales bacterium]|nr:GGDEF domain-containing response regulator [Anaerolineales bacterium]